MALTAPDAGSQRRKDVTFSESVLICPSEYTNLFCLFTAEDLLFPLLVLFGASVHHYAQSSRSRAGDFMDLFDLDTFQNSAIP